MLRHRLATGIATCVVVFGVLFFLPAWTHLVLLFAVFALAHAEWAGMVRKSGFRHESAATWLCGALFLLLTAMESPTALDFLQRRFGFSAVAAYGRMDFSAMALAMTPALLLALGVLRRRIDGALECFALSFAGFWYVAVLLSFIVRMAFEFPLFDEGRTNYTGRMLLLAFIVMVKMSDIGAYTAGRIWGRHKLIPAVSPAKTVEGLCGGYVFSIAAGLAFWAVFKWGFGDGRMGQLVFPLSHAVALPVVLATTAMTGDLAESLIKRSIGVKDASSRFPGMGGILDILDSLLFSAPFMYAY
ncbi:MAG: phosphatidate cytidylyltransferase, partial [Kiritimatiellae bacterium]|nr:phosphatidate cytidylyltransferase [Kiritimatiellia bacterium]